MKILSKEEIYDALTGAEILGCGGGGEIEWGKSLIDKTFEKEKEIKLISKEELPDDYLISIAGFVGGGISKEIQEKLKLLEKDITDEDKYDRPLIKASKELSNYLGDNIDAYLPSETGAGNFAAPMYLSAMENKYIIDGDACGRAKPEIAISTTHVAGLSITPLSLVSPYGDTIILKETLNDYRAEDICRYNSIISGGISAVVRCPARGKNYKKAFIPGTISKCIKLGRSVRKSKEESINPIESFLEIIDGAKVIFTGKIKEWTREKKDAFMWGDIKIDGTDNYKNKVMDVWYKNEFLISWLDKIPVVSCPDLICLIDSVTGKGLSNWICDLNIYYNKNITVIAVTAESIWQTRRGIEIFGPAHFGFDIEYKPLQAGENIGFIR